MIYLDNNATTPLAAEVLEAMMPYLTDGFGNASSSHAAGRSARSAIETARESTAELVGAASANEIIFTSGGTEADNAAILGALAVSGDRRHIVTTRVEHEAVRKLAEHLEQQSHPVTWIGVDEHGFIDLDEFADAVSDDTALVSVMLANNETGVLFPVEQLAEIVKQKSKALFHVDGVNAAGKVPVNLSATMIDLFSISAHKFNGPKGIGALYLRTGVEIPPLLVGGAQERGRRAGTEAVHQIVGLGAAAKLAREYALTGAVGKLRDRLENGILNLIPNSRLNGTDRPQNRLPNTSNISFENLNGEMILSALDDIGVCVSTGSACNSKTHESSPVLRAMNIPFSQAMGSIRFSLGRYNTAGEIDFVLEKLPKIIASLQEMSG